MAVCSAKPPYQNLLLVAHAVSDANGEETLRIILARKADKTERGFMNKTDNQAPSPQEQTALTNLAAMPDEQIDYSDLPATTPEQGRFYRSVKQQLTLRIDADVIAWYKSQGKGYQTRINELLRQAMQEEIKRVGP